jgi:hypothetical protein
VHSATISSKIRFVSGRLELRVASSYEGSSTTSTTWWVLRSLATIECVAVRATTAACMVCTRHHSRRVEIPTVAGPSSVVQCVLSGGPYPVASGGRYPVPTDIMMTA